MFDHYFCMNSFMILLPYLLIDALLNFSLCFNYLNFYLFILISISGLLIRCLIILKERFSFTTDSLLEIFSFFKASQKPKTDLTQSSIYLVWIDLLSHHHLKM